LSGTPDRIKKEVDGMRNLLVGLVLGALACSFAGALVGHAGNQPPATPPSQTLMLNVTSSPTEDPHSVTMALQLAGHALDAGREVVLFFNVRGVAVPTISLPEDLAFRAEPIKKLLANLMERGAQVQVCPHCMHALGVEADDLVPGAVVTDREKLFSKIGPETVVFTY
jgi:predicted peroxiredoxin